MGGGAFLINDGFGYFMFVDSIYFENGYTKINGNHIDDNEYIDVYSTTTTIEPYTINISIIYNYGISQFDSIRSFNIYNESPVPFITGGDVSGDGYADLLFAHNNDFLWGILYNDGTGNFSTPEYYDLTFPPLDIACADLNDDGRGDVVVCGSDTEIYFSTETGFQQLVLTTTLSHDVLISDFDNDGDNDIITHTTFVYPNHRVFFFENLGNNQFLEHNYFQFSPFCSYAQIADFNNDSLPELIFTAYDYSGLYIFNNQGDFQLELNQYIAINNTSSDGLNCNDFDNNGFNDIAIIKDGLPQSTLQLLFNDGEGNFVDDPITIIQSTEFQIQNFSCYPNPFTDNINFYINTKEKSKIILSIYDIQGRIVFSSTIKKQKGGKNILSWNSCDFNNNQVEAGMYLAFVQIDGIFYKLIKLIKR